MERKLLRKINDAYIQSKELKTNVYLNEVLETVTEHVTQMDEKLHDLTFTITSFVDANPALADTLTNLCSFEMKVNMTQMFLFTYKGENIYVNGWKEANSKFTGFCIGGIHFVTTNPRWILHSDKRNEFLKKFVDDNPSLVE